MTRKRLGQALAAALILALCGCKDLKIHTENDQKKFRFAQPVKMWLTYKKKPELPSGASVVWLSNKDGRLGEGQSITISSLSAGKHEINVTGTYKGKKVKGKKLKIQILNDAPVPTISSPAAHETVGVGDTVTLVGSAIDREDGEVPASKLAWRSSKAGALGSGTSVTRSNLLPGTHTILPLERPQQAVHHTLIDVTRSRALFAYWRGGRGGRELTFRATRVMGTIGAIRWLVKRGHGVAVLPRYHVQPDLDRGRLQAILPKVEPRSDYFRLIFRGDDPRRSVYQRLAETLQTQPLK